MPKPKLISFSQAVPESSPEQPKPTASDEIFNMKKSTKAKHTKKDLEVKQVVDDEPEVDNPSSPEPEPVEEVYVPKKEVATKKKISEKQRLHLEKLHKSRREKRAQQSRPSTNVPQDNSRPTTTGGLTGRPRRNVDASVDNGDDKDFERWVLNMEKFDKVMTAREEKARKQQEAEEAKEREMEERIRKKMEAEGYVKSGQPKTTSQPPKQSAPIDILNPPETRENRFGEYSKYFGY